MGWDEIDAGSVFFRAFFLAGLGERFWEPLWVRRDHEFGLRVEVLLLFSFSCLFLSFHFINAGMKHRYCFRRTSFSDYGSSAVPRIYFKYAPIGLGRVEVSGLDIYLHHFPSPFTTLRTRETPLQPTHISGFFPVFVRLYILKMLFMRTANLSTAD